MTRSRYTPKGLVAIFLGLVLTVAPGASASTPSGKLVGTWRSEKGGFTLKQYLENGQITWATNFVPLTVEGQFYFKRALPVNYGSRRISKSEGVWEVRQLGGGTCAYDVELAIHWPETTAGNPAEYFEAEFIYPAEIALRGCGQSGGFETRRMIFSVEK